MIIYSAISSDVAQCSFNKCTAKQMSFESGFKSDLFWKLIPTAGGKIAKTPNTNEDKNFHFLVVIHSLSYNFHLLKQNVNVILCFSKVSLAKTS